MLILGLRYGEVPDGYQKSYTHLELDRAIERGIPVLVLLTGPQHLFTEADLDLGAAGERVLRLREEVRSRGVSYSPRRTILATNSSTDWWTFASGCHRAAR